MEWFQVYDKGKLITYSKLHYAPVGFEEDLPYIIAILDYGDYKVFGRIANHMSQDELEIGMELRTVVSRLPNGQLTYVFQA